MTSEELLKTVGTRTAALRIARGMTRDALAEACSISNWRVTRIERGNTTATVVELVALARALAVTTAVLTGEEKASEFMARVEAAEAVRP